jgi:putative endonuclease
MEKQPTVYMLASERNGTLYIGVTSNLVGRTWQHREHIIDDFTKRYGITVLVWYELHPTMESAILREKQIKKWNRSWKLRLIQETNPRWMDLWTEIIGESVGMDSRLRGNDGPSS